MFLSFICFYIFKNGSYFSFICLVGCFQFFDFFVVVFIGFLFLFCSLVWWIFRFFILF
ncbi:membrane protein [Vibrio cholerae O1 biovar El Tor]|nr:membrane protein [Vibrio cholerae O1 biovar El Tor]